MVFFFYLKFNNHIKVPYMVASYIMLWTWSLEVSAFKLFLFSLNLNFVTAVSVKTLFNGSFHSITLSLEKYDLDGRFYIFYSIITNIL